MGAVPFCNHRQVSSITFHLRPFLFVIQTNIYSDVVAQKTDTFCLLWSSGLWCHVMLLVVTNIFKCTTSISYPADRSSTFFWNVGKHLADYTLSQPVRQESMLSSPWKPPISQILCTSRFWLLLAILCQNSIQCQKRHNCSLLCHVLLLNDGKLC